MSKKWSQSVTSSSLDLEKGVFTLDDPVKIAKSLWNSAKKSRKRKSTPLRSSMSMLCFYINRAGSNLSKKRLKILNKAKDELRKLSKE